VAGDLILARGNDEDGITFDPRCRDVAPLRAAGGSANAKFYDYTFSFNGARRVRFPT